MIQADGYEILRLRGTAVERLCERLNAILGPLEAYAPEADITADQVAASKAIHGMQQWRDILIDNAERLREVVGQKLLYQREPYLRIARPHRPEDQVGIHRDTHYGSSECEWVLWVALTDAVDGAEFRILPGSHLQPDEAYPWTQAQNPNVSQGSEKHWLGFRYAPKKMADWVEEATLAVPCRIGEAILFNCNAVHGQKQNTARWTRMSLDIRLVDAEAQIALDRGIHGQLYVPLREAA